MKNTPNTNLVPPKTHTDADNKAILKAHVSDTSTTSKPIPNKDRGDQGTKESSKYYETLRGFGTNV